MTIDDMATEIAADAMCRGRIERELGRYLDNVVFASAPVSWSPTKADGARWLVLQSARDLMAQLPPEELERLATLSNEPLADAIGQLMARRSA